MSTTWRTRCVRTGISSRSWTLWSSWTAHRGQHHVCEGQPDQRTGETLDIAVFAPSACCPSSREGASGPADPALTGRRPELGIPGGSHLWRPHNYCRHGFRNGKDLTSAMPTGTTRMRCLPWNCSRVSWRATIGDCRPVRSTSVLRAMWRIRQALRAEGKGLPD